MSVPLAMDNYCTSIKRIPLINQLCRKPFLLLAVVQDNLLD